MYTMNKEKKESYSTKQVADILQQSPEAVRKYIMSGKLLSNKKGLRYRVQKQDLYNFLKKN